MRTMMKWMSRAVEGEGDTEELRKGGHVGHTSLGAHQIQSLTERGREGDRER
jgi:hypothetical protein